MSWSLLVLCLAALGIIAAGTSMAAAVALPLLDRVTLVLAPRQRVRAWLWLAALPALLGSATVIATLLPALGLSSDHCLVHDPHHPHLCPHHLEGTPGGILVVAAVLVVARCVYLAIAFARAALLNMTTSRTLGEGSERRGDVLVFEAAEPQAFVLGVISPTIHASRGLLRLGGDVLEPVLAHERAHTRARDSLWRALCPVLAALHLPFVASRIARRLASAQEMAADAEAARELGSPVRVAESLIALARMRTRPAPGLAFTHGDVGARVRALIGPRRASRTWPMVTFGAVFLATVSALGVFHEPVHHALETLLGVLS